MILIEIEVDENVLLHRSEWGYLVKARAKWLCEKCGKKGRDAHHKDHNPKNNRLSNGECLCRSCHRSHHGLVGGWTKGKKRPQRSAEHAKAISEALQKSEKFRTRDLKKKKCEYCDKVMAPGPMALHVKRKHEVIP